MTWNVDTTYRSLLCVTCIHIHFSKLYAKYGKACIQSCAKCVISVIKTNIR